MSWRSTMYNLMYRLSRPRWDTGETPPQVRAWIEGAGALPAGRALDLGCGTGTSTIYLAQHGWDAVGVDFSGAAIARARQKSDGVAGARFIQGDMTRLKQLGIAGPFDFVLDIAAFHGLASGARSDYAQGLADVTRPGAIFLMREAADGPVSVPGVPSMVPNEIADRFGSAFTIEHVDSAPGRRSATWTTLRRK